MSTRRIALAAALAASLRLVATRAEAAPDVVKLGNLKFAHYGAVSYMKEHCGKFGLDVQEIVFPKGIDIFPAIIRGEVDIAASAADAAVANRAGGGPVFVVAGFAKGGARLVIRARPAHGDLGQGPEGEARSAWPAAAPRSCCSSPSWPSTASPGRTRPARPTSSSSTWPSPT